MIAQPTQMPGDAARCAAELTRPGRSGSEKCGDGWSSTRSAAAPFELDHDPLAKDVASRSTDLFDDTANR